MIEEATGPTYSDVVAYTVSDLGYGSDKNLTSDVQEIHNIEVNSTGSVVIYQITGEVIASDDDGEYVVPGKKVITISNEVVTTYFIYD